MAQFFRSCARPTRFLIAMVCTALSGCGDAADPPAPARPPLPAAAVAQDPGFDDPPLRKAEDDVKQAQRGGDRLLESQMLRVYGTLLRSRGRTEDASQVLLAAVAAACTEWKGDDAARRDEAEQEINDGCAAIEELINAGLIAKTTTHGQAVALYGQLHAQMQPLGRRAHAAALRHLQSHHATNAGRLEEAAAWATEAVDERRALGLTVPAAWSLNQLGFVQLQQGRHETAWATLGEAAQAVCGRGLNAAARATINNVMAVIRSHIAAGQDKDAPDPKRTQQGLGLLDRIWKVASGDRKDPTQPGWTAAEQTLVLEQAKELHLLAGDLDGAEQALLAILWIAHRGEVFRPDVEAALWLEMAKFAHEERRDFARALRYCAASQELHQAIGHELGTGWVQVRRGAVLLDQAKAAGSEAAKLQRVQEAIAECTAALNRFRSSGNHRNGRWMAMQYLKEADALRGNPDGEAAWAKLIAPVMAEPPPKPAPAHHFPPVEENWRSLASKLPAGAPIALVVRDKDSWVVTDLIDNTTERVPFDWAGRTIHMRMFEFHLGGATVRTPVKFGGYAIFVPRFHGAQILRNGLILPAGPKLKGAADFRKLKDAFPPPKLRGK
ncbi:MAG: hypothetical protein ACYTGX_08670 [Planctomycetota bacterium]|jgi:tetratricopeptide (TPR) repeat protein